MLDPDDEQIIRDSKSAKAAKLFGEDFMAPPWN